MYVLDVFDARSVATNHFCQFVDGNIRARSGVDCPPDRLFGKTRLRDEPRAVLDVEQVPRLRPVSVYFEFPAADFPFEENGNDAALGV